jgi:DNA-binding SARP family transcriptional activator
VEARPDPLPHTTHLALWTVAKALHRDEIEHAVTTSSHRPRSSGARGDAGRGVGRMLKVVARLVRGVLASGTLVALLAGLPWALIRFIGWPLPDHLPSWPEFEDVLLAPMTTTLLLDILACATWLAWALFALDVARCSIDLVRDVQVGDRHVGDRSRSGPMRRVTTVLLGALLISLLGQRAGATPANSLADRLGPAVVATAPTWPAPRHVGEMATQGIATPAHASTVSEEAAVSAGPRSVVVRAPENGVHDTLWRIAARTLGDGAHWPEIFELNKGRPQPYGHTFTNPNLIFPGEELTLPDAAIALPPPPWDTPAPMDPPNPTQPSPPAPPSNAPSPTPSTQHTPKDSPTATGTQTPPDTREPGFRWGPELFVGLGLAATVSAALVVARRRHNSRYRPGSGDRTEPPLAPVVYQLRLAHLRAEASDTGEDTDFDPDDPADHDQPNVSISAASDGKGERPRHTPWPATLVVGTPRTGAGTRPALAPGLGVRDGREIALDLATARGLGLVGPGAVAATRALLITALTASTTHPSATPQPATTSVLVPADDLARLLGPTAAHTALPATLRVVRDLDDALGVLEAEILVRAAAGREPNTAAWPALVLVTRPPEHGRQRLQAVLDNGAPFGITGLLLGQWQPGVTTYVRVDGTISATGPGLGESLRGTQVFRLGGNDTAALLTLLPQADPSPRANTHADTHTGVTVPPHPTRPRIVGSEPTDSEDHDTNPAAHAELEILGSDRSPRPRPPAVPPQQSTTPRKAEDTDISTNAAVGADHTANGEICDEPAPPSEHNTTACSPPPLATAGTPASRSADPVAVPITITVLGPLRVHWTPEPHDGDPDPQEREITGTLQPRTRELLVLLALHPEGITREALLSALWSEDPPARPTNALHTSLSRLRQAVAAATDQAVADIAVVGNGRYQLDPAKVTVDYWRFATAVTNCRTAPTQHERIDAYRDIVDSYSGPLADGMTTEWIEPTREAIRRDAIDAVAALARALVATDPQQTLDLLEVARTFDPHNELLYRDIMRLQERLGQHDAIPRTLTLLTTRLAELDETPSTQTRGLAVRLTRRNDTAPETAGTPGDPAVGLVSQHDHGHSAAS